MCNVNPTPTCRVCCMSYSLTCLSFRHSYLYSFFSIWMCGHHHITTNTQLKKVYYFLWNCVCFQWSCKAPPLFYWKYFFSKFHSSIWLKQLGFVDIITNYFILSSWRLSKELKIPLFSDTISFTINSFLASE